MFLTFLSLILRIDNKQVIIVTDHYKICESIKFLSFGILFIIASFSVRFFRVVISLFFIQPPISFVIKKKKNVYCRFFDIFDLFVCCSICEEEEILRSI